ncbi:MAG: adenylate/guanylate cyclase domain-containing protein [Gordonia sp. (in: high G+C Gram-positive bacteria)]
MSDAIPNASEDDSRRPARRPEASPGAGVLARVDAHPVALRAVRAARTLVPSTPPQISAGRASSRLAHLIAQSRPEQESASRELGLTAVALWQAVIRRERPPTDPVPATILFTDLVAFSTWALAAGDDQVLRLLREVNAATAEVVTRHGGRTIKHLGDGVMAVFGDPAEAVAAGYEAICAVSALTVDGYRPQLRAGLHTGTPRAVGDDFLGVDVNIAARVAAAAKGGELLVSDVTLADLDPDRYTRRRRRRFRAKGVPRELTVSAIVPRYDDRSPD